MDSDIELHHDDAFILLLQITEQIYVGSCIRTKEDVETLAATAVRAYAFILYVTACFLQLLYYLFLIGLVCDRLTAAIKKLSLFIFN